MKDEIFGKRKEERLESGKQTALTEESVERCGYDDSWEHEWDGSQCTEDGFTAEVVSGKEIGGGKPEEECEESGENGLVESKT